MIPLSILNKLRPNRLRTFKFEDDHTAIVFKLNCKKIKIRYTWGPKLEHHVLTRTYYKNRNVNYENCRNSLTKFMYTWLDIGGSLTKSQLLCDMGAYLMEHTR